MLFYGVSHGCSFDSIVALEWLDRPYRLCRIEIPLETGERTYVCPNPAHQTPTLFLEDGRVFSESLAILQHPTVRDLCRKLGYLQGSAEFGELNFTLASPHTEYHSVWRVLLYLEDIDVTTTARVLAHVTRAYDRIDELLGGRKWLAGEGLGAAGTYLAGTARWGRELGYFDPQHDFPRLHRHLEKLKQGSAVRFTHTIEDRLPVQSCEESRGEMTLAEMVSRLLA